MSALADYCDKQIADTEQLIADYPDERNALTAVLNGWKLAKKIHLAQAARNQAEQVNPTKEPV
ncbi:hypothetical protein [Shewanella acanthi]|uniref:hypothetical protein n=1 Tax=Shewanella acanthi TaxID=2864212 RepID=UPI001C65CCF2|nr:hypothetical protein [Shewanella acanthi]QYJ79404.1 hypothetical protein K0H61_02855 [Shewanella acanthi]